MVKRLSRKQWADLRKEVDRRLNVIESVTTEPIPFRPVVQRAVFTPWSKPQGKYAHTARVRPTKRGQLRRMAEF